MTDVSHSLNRYAARILPNAGLLAFAAIAVYIDSTLAFALGFGALIVAGAKSIASVGRDPAPHGDQAWAEEVLSRSIAVSTMATSLEWLLLLGATFLLFTKAPFAAMLQAAPLLAFAAVVIALCAFGEVLWERRLARQALRATH